MSRTYLVKALFAPWSEYQKERFNSFVMYLYNDVQFIRFPVVFPAQYVDIEVHRSKDNVFTIIESLPFSEVKNEVRNTSTSYSYIRTKAIKRAYEYTNAGF